MFIMGWKCEDENGYESIDKDGIYVANNKQDLLDEMWKLIGNRQVIVDAYKKKRKEETAIIRAFMIENYDNICKSGQKHATVRESKDKDGLIEFFVNNPGYAQEILGCEHKVPHYTYFQPKSLREKDFIITECTFIS